MRIIIVEDEQRARRGLKSLIQTVAEDCEIVADAADGVSALELIKKLKPDVVFTDIKMPFMDGLELIKEARNLDIKTHFVIISAYEEFEYARQAISLEVTDYLVKPIIMDDIQEVMERLKEAEVIKTPQSEPQEGLLRKYENVHPVIHKALRMIEKDYASRISQKDLASELGVSQEYFSYLFTKEIGESFVKFLKRYRIEIAQTLLVYGDVAKEDIAEKVGFSDEKYFHKVFREITGTSITEFLRERAIK